MSFSEFKKLPNDVQPNSSGRTILERQSSHPPREPGEHFWMKVIAGYDEAVKRWLNSPHRPVLISDESERYFPSPDMRALVAFSKEWSTQVCPTDPSELPDTLGEPPTERWLGLSDDCVRMHPHLELFLPMAHYLRNYNNAGLPPIMKPSAEYSDGLQEEVKRYIQQVLALIRRPPSAKKTGESKASIQLLPPSANSVTGSAPIALEPWWMAIERYQKRLRDNSTTTRALHRRLKRRCRRHSGYVVMCVYVGGTQPSYIILNDPQLMRSQLEVLRDRFSKLLKKVQRNLPILEYVWSLVYLPEFGGHYRLMLILPNTLDDTELETLANYLKQKWAKLREGRPFRSSRFLRSKLRKYWWREQVSAKESRMMKTLDSWLLLDQIFHIEPPCKIDYQASGPRVQRTRLRTFGTSHGPRPKQPKPKAQTNTTAKPITQSPDVTHPLTREQNRTEIDVVYAPPSIAQPAEPVDVMATHATDTSSYESRTPAVDAPVEGKQISLYRKVRAGKGKQQRDRPIITIGIRKKGEKKGCELAIVSRTHRRR